MKKKNDKLTARTPDGNPSSAYFIDDMASANEYTGMTPTLPLYETEAESYLDMFDEPVSSADGAQKYRRKFGYGKPI